MKPNFRMRCQRPHRSPVPIAVQPGMTQSKYLMNLTLAEILTTLSSPRMIVLWIFVASAIFIHFRGRERLRFVRQLTDHSTFMAPYNVLAYLFSAVPNQPYLDVTQLPDLAPLRDNWRTIREEALNLYDQDRIKRSEKYHDLAFNSFFRSGWKRFYLKWYGAHHASAQELCPKTVELLEKIPTVKAAMFAMLPPGAKLGRHRDPFAGSLRYHLGLVTPNSDDCRIYVDGKMYSWRDGEAVLFDETFIHWAENATQTARIILFCDVERPLHTGVARAANRFFGRTFVAAAATANEPGEKVGVLNRIFGFFHRMRAHTTAPQELEPLRLLLAEDPRCWAASSTSSSWPERSINSPHPFAARGKRLLKAATVALGLAYAGARFPGPFALLDNLSNFPVHFGLAFIACAALLAVQRQAAWAAAAVAAAALALAPVVPWYFGARRGPGRSGAAVGEAPRLERLLRESQAPAHPGPRRSGGSGRRRPRRGELAAGCSG